MTVSSSGTERSVAVITGGAGGMGLACARRFALRHRIVLVDINADRLDAAAAGLESDGYDVTPIVADISRPADAESLAHAASALGRFGVLVHTAGLSPGMADGRRILAVNLVGTALLERAFLPLAEEGSVAIMIASLAGHMGPFATRNDPILSTPLSPDVWTALADDLQASETAYSISKRGVIVYCESVTPEWGARGARIVTISPGMIETPMNDLELSRQPLIEKMLALTPISRMGAASEIAAAAEFLASKDAAFITGADLRIDGGAAARFGHMTP